MQAAGPRAPADLHDVFDRAGQQPLAVDPNAVQVNFAGVTGRQPNQPCRPWNGYAFQIRRQCHENLPIIVLLFDDQEVGLIRVKQEIKGLPPHGVHIGGVDWEKLGHAFGADAAVVETEQALADALGAALKSSRTTIIAARIDPSGYVAQFNALREL